MPFPFPQFRLSLTLVCILLFTAGTRGEALLWESTQGSRIEAEFVRMEGDSVVLKKADGSGELIVPLSLLSTKSQELLKQLQLSENAAETSPAEEPPTPEPGSAPADGKVVPFVQTPPTPNPKISLPPSTKCTPVGEETLSVFTEGKWQGSHAVYEHEKFDALINDKGICFIYLKNDEGLRISSRPSANISLGTPRNDGVARPVEWVTSKEEAQLQPSRLRFTGQSRCEVETDVTVKFEYTFEFKNDTISWYGNLKNSNNKLPSRFNLALRLNETFGYDLQAAGELEKQDAILLTGDSNVTFSGDNEDPTVFPCWDWPDAETRSSTARKGLNEVSIDLTAFSPRILKLETDPDLKKNIRPVLTCHDVRIFAQFAINPSKTDPFSKDRDECITLTIK